MKGAHPNSFQFTSTKGDGSMTVLKAEMSDFSYAKHAHDELSLGVTLEGVQEFSCNGSFFRSFPGDIILFNPGEVHNGNPGNNLTLKYVMLYLEPKIFYPLLGSAANSNKIEYQIPRTNFSDSVVQSLILGLSQLVNAGKYATLEYEHRQYELAKRLAQVIGIFSPDLRVAKKDSLLLRAREYICDNIEKDISIDELCKVVNISKYHFIRLFRTQFGLSPHRYILNRKVNKARADIETGVPPSEVAQNWGFYDVSHLNRHFKRSYGLTPKQYQKQLLQQSNT